MTQETQNSRVIEFYEHTTKLDPNLCDHIFTRLSVTRVLCKKCGLGFFDNPFDPFPVEEMNKETRKQIKENKKLKESLKEKVDNE